MSKELVEVILKQQEQIDKLSNIVELLSEQNEEITNISKEEYLKNANEVHDDWFEESKKLKKLNAEMPEYFKENKCHDCKTKRSVKFSNLTKYDYSCDCDEEEKRLKSIELRIIEIEKMLKNPNKVIVGNTIKTEKLILKRLDELKEEEKIKAEFSSYSEITEVIDEFKKTQELSREEEETLKNILKKKYKISGSILKDI